MLDSQLGNANSTQPLVEEELRPFVEPQQGTFRYAHALQAIKSGQPISNVVQRLLSELTNTERLQLLDGDDAFWVGVRKIICDRYNRLPFVHGAIPHLGIPGILFTDGPRGVVIGSSTAFPVAMARGATWDTSIERRIGDAIGREAKAQGANLFAGVCINLPRHPAWGRVQETYGEDPILLGHFGVALTEGVQNHIMACVKHFALNSMENARFRVDVRVADNVLHEVYLPHFRRVIEAGAAAVMSAYNSVNGEWAGQSRKLLTEILRNQWKFDGFTMSDFIFGLRDAPLSVKNGLDIEAPFMQQRHLHLAAALDSERLSWEDVSQACARILMKQMEFEIKTEPSKPEPSIVFCEEHRALAREAASRGIVVLKNEAVQGPPILPLDPRQVAKIGLFGRLANTANTGDRGSSQVFPPHVVTPYEGVKASNGEFHVILEDSGAIEKAENIAGQVDLAICVVGYDATDEGEYVVPSLQHDPSLLNILPPVKSEEERETLDIMKGASSNGVPDSAIEVGSGGDRKSLRLRPEDIELIRGVSRRNSKTVVIVIAAGAVIMEEWKDTAQAILMAWYSGSEGGHALADVLFGRVDASGRLPFSIPKEESHLPYFDTNATEIEYDRWFGQSLLDRLGVEASFPLGFGLSYTNFYLSDLYVEATGSGSQDSVRDSLLVHIKVTNTGRRKGIYVAQIYGKVTRPDFPSRLLLGFSTIHLDVSQSKSLLIDASLRPLQQWAQGEFIVPDVPIDIEAASFAGDPNAIRSTIQF